MRKIVKDKFKAAIDDLEHALGHLTFVNMETWDPVRADDCEGLIKRITDEVRNLEAMIDAKAVLEL